MVKKRSIGITIFSLLEIVLGSLGSISMLASSIYIFSKGTLAALMGLITVPMIIPCLHMLIVGKSTFQLKPAGIENTLILSQIWRIIFILLFLINIWTIFVEISIRSSPIDSFYYFTLLFTILGIIFFSTLIYYFTRPKVKAQFK